MKKFSILFGTLLAMLTELSSSFGIGFKSTKRIPVWSNAQQGDDVVETNQGDAGGMLPTLWIDKADENFMKKVEEEIVQRYKEQGFSDDDAQREVSVFLSDKEQAEKYLEMKLYSAAQADEIGLGLVAQLVGGFFVGFSIIAGPKFLQAYQAASLDSFPSV